MPPAKKTTEKKTPAKRKKKQSAAALAIADTAEERDKIINDLVERSSKLFGKGSLGTLRGRFAHKVQEQGVIHTGSLALDKALGIGGFPHGRIVEIYGPESSGKTTMMLHAIAECQKAGGLAAFVDAEHAFDPNYAEKIGVDLEHLLLSQPDSGEQALQLVEVLVESGALTLIVVDSVSALVPQAEIDGDIGDHHVGLQARMMSQAMRKLCGAAHGAKTVIAFINQIRYKIGVRFGSPETTSGGNALKFYSTIRLDIRRIGSVKQGEAIIGNRVKIKVVKNKMAPPFQKVEADLIFGRGIAWEYELIDMGLAQGHITKAGSWYSYGDERLGQGRVHTATRLREDDAMAAELRAKVLA